MDLRRSARNGGEELAEKRGAWWGKEKTVVKEEKGAFVLVFGKKMLFLQGKTTNLY